MFKPLPTRQTAVDACEERIQRAILQGDLAPGSRLPPERVLAEQFGVNRLTLRSALARLSAASLIRVRQGSGYTVLDYREEAGPRLLPSLIGIACVEGHFPIITADLLLVRRQLARALLERLATDTPPLAAVSASIDAFEACVREGADLSSLTEADLAVVTALVDATGSAVLRLCLNPILQVLRDLPELAAAIYAEPLENIAGWRALVTGLEAGVPGVVDLAMAQLETRDARTLERLQ